MIEAVLPNAKHFYKVPIPTVGADRMVKECGN